MCKFAQRPKSHNLKEEKMMKLKKTGKSTTHNVKVESKNDIDKISRAFDVYSNPAISDEIILDTELINECEDATATAIEVFGEVTWNELPIGLVLFHG